MADVTVKYNGSTIAELNAEGSKTLKTSGKYCENNIDIAYIPKLIADSGFLSLTTIDVTIGANTVSLGSHAVQYLNELADFNLCAAALLNNPTTQNQLLLIPGAAMHPSYTSASNTSNYKWMKYGYRYRTDGTAQANILHSDYAFVLKEGTKYRLWIANIKTSVLKPY